ncbi:TonB-dependent receptor domain-containing protein [Vibrio ulleungensis]|uniref:TonB-dependent receptor n=1 Tax=Vibrio ulleungensis TaxID=2807619 RepID=A0ABS2HBG8_9VIBR|nr:TonB-dependent receptor [Vibrio ulleungensis]MBM7034948.1 TonB-dependent receptor [Vibrio ulleungensis]
MKITPLASKVASLCLCAPLFTSPFVFAQDTSDEPVELTISYTANRFEQPTASVLASVSTVTREQIETLNADSALDVLRTLSGVEVASQGTRGSTTGVFLRGTNSNQTVVLVDGVRINSPSSGAAQFGLIPAFAIEKIEVIRGPRAAVYGSDAIGGVISITTIPSNNDSVNEIALNGGSNRYNQQAWRTVGQISDKTSGSFVVNNESDAGYNSNQAGPDDEEYGYSTQSLFGNLNHQFNEQWSAAFNGYTANNTAEFWGYDPNTFTNVKDETTQQFYSVAGSVAFKQNNYRSVVQYNLTNDELGTRDVEKTRAEAIISAKRHTVSWINTVLPTDYLTLNVGLDFYKEYADQSGANDANFANNKKDNAAIFATSLLDFGDTILELSARYDDNSAFGDHLTWNAAAGYYLTDSIQLTAGAGTAFKAPTFNDLYWPEDPYGVGNPDLKPETSISGEIGIRGQHDKFDWSLAAYSSTIEDLIEWMPVDDANPFGQWTPTNVSEAEIKGIELEVAFDTGPVEHQLVGDWKDTENVTTGEQLIRRAKQNYKWVGTYRIGALSTTLDTQYVGERLDASGDMMDAYTLVNLAAIYQFTDNFKANVKINNLLDKDYETSYYGSDFVTGEKFYYVGPERSFYAGLNYKF